jgi:50S ribosomal subunit-associated GTPase HflX
LPLARQPNLELLGNLEARRLPIVIVANKIDKYLYGERRLQASRFGCQEAQAAN